METMQPTRPPIRVEESAHTDLILTELCKRDEAVTHSCLRDRADSLALQFTACGIASRLSPQQCLRQIGIVGSDPLTTWPELRNLAFQRFLGFLQRQQESVTERRK